MTTIDNIADKRIQALAHAACNKAIGAKLSAWRETADLVRARTYQFAPEYGFRTNKTLERERLARIDQSIKAMPDIAYKLKIDEDHSRRYLIEQERADYEFAKKLQEQWSYEEASTSRDAEYARELQEQWAHEDTRASRIQREHERDMLEYEPINMPAGAPIEPTLIYTPSIGRSSAEQRQAQAKMDKILKMTEEITRIPLSDEYKRDLAEREREERERTAQLAAKREQSAATREYEHLHKRAEEMKKSWKFERPDDEPAPAYTPKREPRTTAPVQQHVMKSYDTPARKEFASIKAAAPLTVEEIKLRTSLTEYEKKQLVLGSIEYKMARRRGFI